MISLLSLFRRAVPLAAVVCLTMVGEAQAQLLSTATYTEYYTNSPPSPTVTSSTTTNANVVAGSLIGLGIASGNADYGTINSSVSSSASYDSRGQLAQGTTSRYDGQVNDTLTFYGGTGSVIVTMLISLSGSFGPSSIPSYDYAYYGQIYAGARISDQASGQGGLSQIGLDQSLAPSLYGSSNPGLGRIDLTQSSSDSSWTSADGVFRGGELSPYYLNISPFPSSTFASGSFLTLTSFNYNTPYSVQWFLRTLGQSSAFINTSATYSFVVPDGTSIGSASGYNYAITSVPEPSELAGLLGLAFMGSAAFVTRRIRRTQP